MNVFRPISTRIAVLTGLIGVGFFLASPWSSAQDRRPDPERMELFRQMQEGRGEGRSGEGRSRGGRGGFGGGRSRGNNGGERGGGNPWANGGGGNPWGGGGGGFGRGGQNPWGGGRGGDENGGDDDQGGRGGWGGGWGGPPGGDDDSGGSHDRSSGSHSGTADSKKPRQRVTVDMPSSFLAADSDHDGQVGLYEWRSARRPLSEFSKLDENHDGFLTPAELDRSKASLAAAGSPVEGTPASDVAAAPKKADDAASETIVVDETSVSARQARNMFQSLDRDHNGSVSTEEWARSSQLKPLFEAAGIDISQPMSSDQFVMNYVRLKQPRG